MLICLLLLVCHFHSHSFCVYAKGEKVVDLWGGVVNKSTNEPWKENTLVCEEEREEEEGREKSRGRKRKKKEERGENKASHTNYFYFYVLFT